MEQYRAGDAEDRRRRADAEGEGDDGKRRERRRATKQPRAVTQIAKKIEHTWISGRLDRFNDGLALVQHEDRGDGLPPEMASRSPGSVHIEILGELFEQIADEGLALRCWAKVIQQPDSRARRRRRYEAAHGASKPRSSPRAMRRSTSTDWRNARRPAAVIV